jgi:hypothetical protein
LENLKRIISTAIILFWPLLLTHSNVISKLPGGYQYVFPGQASKDVHPSSTIIVRLENISPRELMNPGTFIQVSGENSGQLPGKTITASDNRTLIFESGKSYEPGEKVKVMIEPRLSEYSSKSIKPLYYEFTVLGENDTRIPFPEQGESDPNGPKKKSASSGPIIMSNGVSVPSDFPHVNITHNSNPSSDYIFLNNWGPPNYNIIFDTSGAPVWYWKTPGRRRDFKVQSNGLITMLVRDGYGGTGEGFIVLDQNFEFIKSIRASNGYDTDEHELYMLPDSGYFLIGRRETLVDMSQYVPGGQTNASVRETCIQEFTADDELIFIWRAWDHFDIRDLEIDNLTGANIRFPHMNSIFTDDDGHILLSSRHLSEISKIHRQSGEFIWRLSGIPGSPNNDFDFVDDPLNGFRNQHAIRPIGNNRYALFDNGNLHSPQISRALEYLIDTVQMRATLVWEYRTDINNRFSRYMGNTQRLPNGNTHINWAVGDILPIAMEVTPAGEKVFEMWFTKGYHCYRSFRHPWNGECLVPYLLLEPQADNITLIFNKFGDNSVDYYKIYGDTVPNPVTLLDTSFKTLKHLRGLENGNRYFFRVTAVDKDGSESDFSNEETISVNFFQPGSDLIVNGDFRDSLDAWTWIVDSMASAEVQVDNGICNFKIQDGGDRIFHVQLRQNGIQLIQGLTYTFEFDAWADAPRVVEIKIGKDDFPYTNYSRINYLALSSTPEKFTFTFDMLESTDTNCRVVINAGLDAQDIYIDNLSLIVGTPATTVKNIMSKEQLEVFSNFPNPFNNSTIINYSIPVRGHVSLKIFDDIGREVRELINEVQSPGNHQVNFDASHLESGIYFYRIITGDIMQTEIMLLNR